MVDNAFRRARSTARSRKSKSSPRSRVVALVLIAAAASGPALVLRAFCAGRSCNTSATAAAEAPFCSLPSDLRRGLIEGFYDGRSPDVLAVAATTITGGTGHGESAPPGWPSVESPPDDVPIVFWGAGVSGATEIGPGTGLDDIAPTIAEIIGLARPHPEVRSGRAIPGVASGERPRLVLEIVLEEAGAGALARSREPSYLRSLMNRGAATMTGDTVSQPADPAARLTTIGTGGSPRQHGITGSLVRNDAGEVTRAWGPGAPVSVIAALGDDLDHAYDARPRVGLVARRRSDRGLIGGGWYVDNDRDDVEVAPRNPIGTLEAILRSGYGDDDVVDLMALTLEGSPRALDQNLRRAVAAATSTAPGSVTVVVTSTGSHVPARTPRVGVVAGVERAVPGAPGVVAGAVPGGLFLDQELLAAQGLPDGRIVTALRALGEPGHPVFADTFPATAVAFGRYC